MGILDEMTNPAQLRGHLHHWREEAAREDGGYLHRIQAEHMVKRLEARLAEVEANPPPPETTAEDLLQADLRELLILLGMGDHPRPASPHAVFQEALGVLRGRLAGDTERTA